MRFVNSEEARSGYRVAGLHYLHPLSKEEIFEECQTTGQYCAALIAINGWQIKDDYPW